MNKREYLGKSSIVAYYDSTDFKPVYKEVDTYKLCKTRFNFISDVVELFESIQEHIIVTAELWDMIITSRELIEQYGEENKDKNWFGEYHSTHLEHLNFARKWYIENKKQNN